MKLTSSVLIICLGSFLVVNTILNLRKKPADINISEIPQNNKNLLPVALSIGVVPCPGAVILLLFTINMGILALGIPLALIMALGMTVVISSIGSITVVAKKSIFNFTSDLHILNSILQSGLKISGAFFIIVIGSLILLGNL
jgi:ABC-type nickel/cobalt efflux system permease component RcnA